MVLQSRRLVFLDPMTDVEEPIRKDVVHGLWKCASMILPVGSCSICNTFPAAVLISVELPTSSFSASRPLDENRCDNHHDPVHLPCQDYCKNSMSIRKSRGRVTPLNPELILMCHDIQVAESTFEFVRLKVVVILVVYTRVYDLCPQPQLFLS